MPWFTVLQTAWERTPKNAVHVCASCVWPRPNRYAPFFVLRIMLSPVLEEVFVCLRVSPPTLRQVDPNIAFLLRFPWAQNRPNATQLETLGSI